MTSKEKKVFIHDLIATVKSSIMDNVDRMPEEWDGHELRQYIAEYFARQTTTMGAKRKREYANAVLVENL